MLVTIVMESCVNFEIRCSLLMPKCVFRTHGMFDLTNPIDSFATFDSIYFHFTCSFSLLVPIFYFYFFISLAISRSKCSLYCPRIKTKYVSVLLFVPSLCLIGIRNAKDFTHHHSISLPSFVSFVFMQITLAFYFSF